jgi:uncharacterized cupredoxin-like copper-binding protein
MMSTMTHAFSYSPLRVLSRAVLVAGAALTLLACGNGEDQQANERDASEAASADPDTTVVEVTMQDHAYEPSSITVPAGQPVTLEFENAGSVEHYFVVGDSISSDGEGFEENLFSGVSIEKSKQAEAHEEEDEAHDDEHEEEHHENEFELPPGGSGSITFTLPESKAGTYTTACFETTGGKKHYELGMKGSLTVTADAEN